MCINAKIIASDTKDFDRNDIIITKFTGPKYNWS